MRVFVAGAGGVIGRRLVPQLVKRGHGVVASTHDAGKVDGLRALGATPAVMDGLDPASVGEAVARAEPDVVVHQMTALAGFADLKSFDRGFARTNELRTQGRTTCSPPPTRSASGGSSRRASPAGRTSGAAAR